MRNLVSFNHLKNWSITLNEEKDDYGLNQISEYFECLTECDNNQKNCRKECRVIFT